MKKRHSIHLLLAAAALLLATAACTKDELADGDRLPEGQYPVEIARITLGVEGGEAQPWGAPQTRVSENGDGTGSVWDWNGTEMIGVQLGGETTTYTLNADKTLSTDAPLYWQNTQTATVTAWYPAADGTLNLGDQSQNLAYLLSGTGTGNYQNPVELTFTHQLAKVRVTPTDDALGEVQSLQLYTYTQCTYEKGTVVQGSQEGWIEMKKCEYTENSNAITCWEANVVPGYEIKKLRANGTEERDLSAAINPVAGKFYNITLDKDKGYTEVSEGNYTVDNEKGLRNLAKLVNSNGGKTPINITLTGDITLTEEWTPIGTSFSNSYTGTFDGGNYTITGLTVTTSDQYAGLFGCIDDGGTVKNVVLENVQIASDNQYANVGGVAGYSRGNIENCSVSGSVSGNSNSNGTSNCVGGVVGQQYGGTITECTSSAIVDGRNEVGGVVGQTNNGATLTACYATGDVTAERDPRNNTYAGGVVGFNGVGTLTACYATGNVTGTGTGSGSIYVGGVTGDNASGTLTACYHAAETVSGPDGATGGVTGRNYDANVGIPSITACYWQNNQAQGIGNNQAGTTDGTTQVDGPTTWQTAVDAMNTALQSASSEWRYELTGELPTLTKN